MSVNMVDTKCSGCKYKGIYLCTNSRKCEEHELYEKVNIQNKEEIK